MCNYEWISDAKEHFENYGGQTYQEGDDTSEQSKEIKSKLKEFIQVKLENNNQVVLSEWCVQGQRRLNHGIWYMAHHEDFGPYYPVVFRVYLGSEGLNIAIQIYNKLLPDQSLLEMLGGYISNAVENTGLQTRQRNNADEPYSDFGYFGVEADEIDENFNHVLEVYQDLPKQISSAMFDKMIELYQTALSSMHCKIDVEDDEYQDRIGVRGLVNDFIGTDNIEVEQLETQFKSFWDIMSSAQQAACATNIIRNNGGIVPLKENIQHLVGLDNQEGTNLLDVIQGCIKNSKHSALELYYLYHMQEDNFPLINGCSEKALRIIRQNKIDLGPENITVMTELQDLMPEDAQLPEDERLYKYYLVDQFLNLLDKIKYEEINTVADESKELYKLAYLFTFFRKVHKTNNAEFFDDLLKKSKNIILYGAPGTGKTYTSEENIRRIIEENSLDNEDINSYDRFKLVQFHPSYSYEDFMEGLKPVMDNGNVTLELKKGDFMLFCESASEYADQFNRAKEKEKMKYAFFFMIDEINRAELSRVFGELMYALDKRGQGIYTQYSYLKKEEKSFSIPENVYLIGTMNDVDRSIDSFDLALRRRFLWYRMDCDYSVIQSELSHLAGIGELNDQGSPTRGYLKACYDLNQYITQGDDNTPALGKLYELGHSYFMAIRNHISGNKEIKNKHLKELFDFSISPLLKEYLRTLLDERQLEGVLAAAEQTFKLPNEEQ